MGLKKLSMTIAWVFPGQGSQKLGMGNKVIKLPKAEGRFKHASEVFRRDLFRICEKNPEDNDPNNDLNNTRNTQICLFLVESILLDSLKAEGYLPSFIAGHSLGEITALYCADVLSFEDCVSLIKVRSELMSDADHGSMAALIGFDRNELDLLISKIDDVVIANDNSSNQVVLSGSDTALDSVSELISCKRFIKLNVSGAFHSPFMKKSSVKFAKYLDNLIFNEPTFSVISNSKPSLSKDPKELKIRLKDQMCNGVRWRETMNLMAEKSDLHIVEIGPSNVLGGLAKRHLKDVKISQISSCEELTY